MHNRRAASRSPIVLIVDDKEWSTRSLESVLAPGGYAVMRAYTGAQGFERVRTQPPDAVFVSSKLPDGDGITFCRSLRDDPQFGSAIPIIVTNPERPTREDRLSALQAGAWDVVAYPIDAQELKLRIESYMRAKLESEQIRDRCLIDQLTGLYNLRGLERRDRELRSQAYREAQPLACVVMSLAPEGQEEAATEEVSREAAVRLGKALRQAGRISDAIGRMGPTEFAILAPSTDAKGAALLIERIATTIETLDAEAAPGDLRLGFRAGYDAVENVRERPVEARELMLHATMALRGTKTNGERVRAF